MKSRNDSKLGQSMQKNQFKDMINDNDEIMDDAKFKSLIHLKNPGEIDGPLDSPKKY